MNQASLDLVNALQARQAAYAAQGGDPAAWDIVLILVNGAIPQIEAQAYAAAPTLVDVDRITIRAQALREMLQNALAIIENNPRRGVDRAFIQEAQDVLDADNP